MFIAKCLPGVLEVILDLSVRGIPELLVFDSSWEMKCICIMNFQEPGVESYDLSFKCFFFLQAHVSRVLSSSSSAIFRGAWDLGGKVYLEEVGIQGMFSGAGSDAYFLFCSLLAFS